MTFMDQYLAKKNREDEAWRRFQERCEALDDAIDDAITSPMPTLYVGLSLAVILSTVGVLL